MRVPVGKHEHLVRVAAEEVDDRAELIELDAVRDEPGDVEATASEERAELLPGVPEPPAEDTAKGNSLLVDVSGYVDRNGQTRVSDGDHAAFALDLR